MLYRLFLTLRYFFDLLPSLAGILLATLSFALVFVKEIDEYLKDRRRIRWFLAAALAVIGTSAFVSDIIQKTEDKTELQTERTNAANDRKTAADDRRILLQQNSQVLAFGQSQATHEDVHKSESDAASGFAKLEAVIRGRPAVQTTAPELPPPTVEHTHYTYRRAPSNNPQFPFGLQVIVQSDITISPVAFAVECNGEVGAVSAFISGHGAYMDLYMGPSPKNKDVALVQFTFPALEPETPLVITILSKEDIRVKQISKYRP